MSSSPFVNMPNPESPEPGLSGYVFPMTANEAPFGLIIFSVEPGASTEAHCHEIREYWLITTGSGQVIYENEEYEVKEGDFLYFEPQKTHQVKNTSKQLMRIVSIDWYGKSEKL